jgi:hypothetical protein
LILLNQVVARLDHDVVFIAEDGGDLVRDPLLHQVNVDLFNVDLLIELRWEFGRLEALLIDAHRHFDDPVRLFDCVGGIGVCDAAGVKCKRLGALGAARRVGL